MRSFQFSMPVYEEKNGKLGTFEPATIPGFEINRIFYIFDVPKGENRANHACMNAAIVFIAITGSAKIYIEEADGTKEYLLNNKSTAVYAPEASWIRAYDFSQDAILIGYSNKEYDECQYINDYSKYKMLTEKGKK